MEKTPRERGDDQEIDSCDKSSWRVVISGTIRKECRVGNET